MFFNRNKIPNYSIENDKDLFRMDEDDFIEDPIDKVITTEPVEKEKKEKIKKEINKQDLLNKIVTISIIIISILMVLSLGGILKITRFNKLPILVVKKEEYDDAVLYKGIGYKVIRYNCENENCDMIIGSYSLKYSRPTKASIVDISMDYSKDINNFADKYLNKYVTISGVVKKYNGNSLLVKSPIDETVIECNNSSKSKIKEGKTIYITGVISDYNYDKGLYLYMNNCK